MFSQNFQSPGGGWRSLKTTMAADERKSVSPGRIWLFRNVNLMPLNFTDISPSPNTSSSPPSLLLSAPNLQKFHNPQLAVLCSIVLIHNSFLTHNITNVKSPIHKIQHEFRNNGDSTHYNQAFSRETYLSNKVVRHDNKKSGLPCCDLSKFY